MKIVQVLLSPRIGGAETLAASLDAEWRRFGLRPQTVFLDPPDRARGRFSRFRELRRTLRSIRPDVIVAHSALPAVYSRAAAGRVPTVSVLHSATDDFEVRSLRLSERLLRRRTAAVVAVVETQARKYLERFGTDVPVVVIPNGIATAFTDVVNVGGPETLIVETARVAAQKEPHLWLEALGAVRATHPHLELEWWGPIVPVSDRDSLLDAAASAGLPGVFKGETADVASVLARASLLVHAASREAHSIGLLEAAAVGVPIVCSDSVSRGLPDWIPVETFAAGSRKELERAVVTVLERIEDARRAALEASRRVREEFTAERCALSYYELLKEIKR